MAIFLIPGLTPATAGTRAGFISSSYMVGRTVSSYAWGGIADTVGRKPVFYISFIIPGIFSILFGLSTSFSMALFSRFMMGVGNGLMLAAKTTVSELAKGDDQLEAKGMGLVMGMWGYGFLVCPAISGVLSEPVKQYPDFRVVQYFEHVLTRYPFLLPNLVSVLMCVMGFIGIYFFVEETLPEDKRKPVGEAISDLFDSFKKRLTSACIDKSSQEVLPLQESSETNMNYTYSEKSFETDILTSESSHGTNKEEDDGLMPHTESCTMLSTSVRFDSSKAVLEGTPKEKKSMKKKMSRASMASLWAVPATRHHLMIFWLMSFMSVVLDEAFPLFSIAKVGGINLLETGIGKILSGAGLLFVCGQYIVYTYVMKYHGLYGSQVIGSILATPITIIMPLGLYLNSGQAERNHLSWSAYIFFSLVLGCKNVCNNIAFSSIAIATNRSVVSTQRASVNGLSMLGGSFAKALGPAVAGFLVTFSLEGKYFSPYVGDYVLFGAISSGGIYCVYYILTVLKTHYKDGTLVPIDH